MNKNVNTIELATRLAEEIIGELIETNQFTYDDFYVEDDDMIVYTELGQNKFDEHYDFYLSLIDDCEVKYSDDYTEENGGIKHYCVTQNQHIYYFNSSKEAKVLYDKLKAEGNKNIQLIRVFNNETFEIFEGELEPLNIGAKTF
jgi:hypothetical protein